MKWKGLYEAPDSGGNSGGSDQPTTPNADSQTPGGSSQQPNTQTGGEKPGEGSGGEPSEVKLTSAQLSDRLERARGAERAAFLKTLGFDSEKALQDALKAGKSAVSEKMTESERKEAEIKDLQGKFAEAQEKLSAAEKVGQELLIRSEAVGLMAGRFAKPSAAIKLLDMSGVKVTDGKVSGLAEAIEQLAKDEPWTLLPTGGSGKPTAHAAAQIGATNPLGSGDAGKENDDEKRRRYLGAGRGSDTFFEGGGVKAANKK